MVGDCHSCDSWANDLENYSPKAELIVNLESILALLALVMLLLISTSPSKKAEALEHLGADSFLVSRDQDELQTVSATHPIMPLLGLLKSNGKLIMVGAPYEPLELPVFSLIIDIEVISMDYVNKAMERLEKADVRYRFVFDIGNTLAATKPSS
ncbi:hypothetical protein Gogos_005440 [Gossypium gossypioides]|uniref:cinnamyl-alcohol dehydrogenase n=1 Tax=Gossypium gossypioides TaxID=34282 RepID=A0A7J9CXS0_GOSGO|nr:hypothetical protein [Gossypium gossypioides]